MKRVLMVSSEAAFFEKPGNAINRRGVQAFPVLDMKDGEAALEKLPVDLVIYNATNRVGDMEAVHDEISAVATSSLPVLLIAGEKDEAAVRDRFADLASLFVATYPNSSRYLLDLSNRLLSVANRKYVRVLVQARKVRAATPGAPPQTHFGFSRNISETGMLLESEAHFEVGEIIILGFMLPGTGGMIEVRAEVVRSQEGGGVTYFGMRFTDLGVGDRQAVAKYTG
jgi:hypothetical protein